MDASMKLLLSSSSKFANVILVIAMSNAELATGYAALILADEGLEITADKLATLTKAAGVDVESIWTQLFAKALEGKDVKDMLLNVGGMPITNVFCSDL
jgi:ribosomal protein L12E/L44/L45/RPP1/RPP2